MNRTPVKSVRQALRREVGFGCPVPGCRSPYLEWHHFDPPWHVEEHHNPSGMIALCSKHHPMADRGAYSTEQLHRFKTEAQQRNSNNVEGRFEWMRNRILVVVGSNFYYETPVILEFRGTPITWLNRDEDDYLLLNLGMLTTSLEERLQLEDNFWIAKGKLADFNCPPSGKLIKAEYANGDMVRIEYHELTSAEEVTKRYPNVHAEGWPIELPVTSVEVNFTVGGTEIEFGQTGADCQGTTSFKTAL